MIYFVGAYANKKVMGKDGHLPWPRMAADIKRLHSLTKDKTIVMGERTYQEYQNVKHAFGVGEVIVISRSHSSLPDAQISSLEEVLDLSKTKDLWVIGGATIFKLLINSANKMYLTEIDGDFDGDVFFPEYSLTDWHVVKKDVFPADLENPYPYTFLELERVK
jgi:dihydrofolate reductase